MQALGQGTISIGRLEREIANREETQTAVRLELESVNQRLLKLDEGEFDAELVRKNLQDFSLIYDSLEPPEQAEVLQYLLKSVNAYPERLEMEVFDLPGFNWGSKNRPKKYPRLDSNQLPSA